MSLPVQQKPWADQYTLSLLKKGDRIYQVFSPKKTTGRSLFAIYSHILGNVVQDIENHCLEKIKSPPSPASSFRINQNAITKSFDGYAVPFGQDIEENKGADRINEALKLSGLSKEELVRCAKIAKQAAVPFFKSLGEPVFSYSETEDRIKNWCLKTSIAGQNHLYRTLGMKESEVSFTDEDLETFGIQRGEIKSDPAQLSCLCYALLKAKEVHAKDLIFKKGADDESLKHLLHILETWNYDQVAEPAPGDLVVYLTGDNVEHAGVYIADDRVQSKIGYMNPFSHVHRLFDIEYRAIFFRKIII